jgi:hypothetical protein
MRLIALTLLAALGSVQTNGGFGQDLPASCVAGTTFARTGASAGFYFCATTDTWMQAGGGSGESVPAGSILLIASGACPTDYTEETSLNGKTLIGTLAANTDVGTTGGSDTITDVINHTHPVTDPGHVHVENQNSATTGGLTGWGARDTSTNTSAATGYSTASAQTGVTTTNPAGGVASLDNRSAFTKVIFCRKT